MHRQWTIRTAVAAVCFAATLAAQASSHREAPFITEQPKVDATDFYMFRSYEPGREGYITLIANYVPLQSPYAGPNYFTLDPDALYEIHVDNDGDGVENLTFQFEFNQHQRNIALNVGGKNVAIPLVQAGPITSVRPAAQNVVRDIHGRPGVRPAPRPRRTPPDQPGHRFRSVRQTDRQHRQQDAPGLPGVRRGSSCMR